MTDKAKQSKADGRRRSATRARRPSNDNSYVQYVRDSSMLVKLLLPVPVRSE